MSQSTNDGEPGSGGVMSRVRTPVIFLLGLVLVLGAYYFLYAQKKTNYLVGRNLRLLATMGNMVGEAISSYGNWVKSQDEGKALEGRGLNKIECPVEEDEIRAIRKSKREPLFRLRGTGLELAHINSDVEAGTDSKPAKSDPEPSCYEIDAATFFPALFDSKGAFDGMLLAKTTGEVVYQHQVPDLGVTHLGPLLAKRESKDLKKSAEEEVSSVSSAASYRNVEIGGREYKLFIEPISLRIGSSFAGSARETWLLCGLVAADKFVYESLAISSSLLLLILAPLLLSALAWPLIRLRLIGERQRIRVFDVLLLGICSLLGVAILTLSLLDFYAYAQLKSVSEEQLRGFASDMASQISEEIKVAYDQLADLQQQVARGSYTASQQVNEPAPQKVNEEAKQVSPSWNRFALVDGKGEQKLRWSRVKGKFTGPQGNGSKRRLINVQDREYFKRALKGDRLWTLPGSGDRELGSFFLESLRSRTSNKHEAVIAAPALEALKTEERGYAVATLTIPMRSAIEPITPPGFEFAVIDDKGSVLFHTNPKRNGVENFFTETDDDRRVRSAVFARRGAEMDIRYFGKDYMAVVQPVGKLPWTVVGLRDAEQLQALNLEWVVTTVLFLLFCSSPFVVVLLAIAVARPGYRAPWLWPDPNRAGDYLNLATLLAMYCLAFGVAIEHLPGAGQLLGIAWTLPFFALLTCYVRLQERATHSSVRKIAVYTGYGLLSFSLLWTLFADRSREDGSRIDFAAAAAVALLILATSMLSVRHPARWRRWAEKFHLPVARAYPLAALLLVVLTTVLPTLGIFKAVHRLELYSFIRHGQLKLARGLAERLVTVKGEDRSARGSDGNGPLRHGFYGSSFFETGLPSGETAPCPCDAATSEKPLPELFEDLLPHYSAHSAEMRELSHDRASDCSWDSHRVLEDAMDLHLRGGGGSEIHLTSSFPGLFTRTSEKMLTAGFPGKPSGGSLIEGAVLILCVFLLMSVIFQLVLFISQRLFLVDVREPLWTVAGDTLAPIAGRNLFLVRRSPISHAETDAMGLKYLHLGEIDEAGDPGGEVLARRCRELVDSGSGVLVAGFEHRISDPAFNARKLALLENLMELRERSLIVLSQVSPARLFSCEPADASPSATAGSPGICDRWRAVLCSFTVVEEDLRSRPTVSRAPSGSFWGELLKPFLRWRGLVGATTERRLISSPVLREESGRDPFLRKIAQGVDLGRHGMGREQLLEEFGERAESYYSAVWESCSCDEKVVLQHLAQEGLVHEKNRRVIRRLMARGLIRRGPNFCLLNESFRRFACSALCKSQVLAFEQSAAPSAWDRFRWPFLAVLSASIAFFFATQQQLLDSTLAAVTGLTAGLPAVVKIIDLLGSKRSGGSK